MKRIYVVAALALAAVLAIGAPVAGAAAKKSVTVKCSCTLDKKTLKVTGTGSGTYGAATVSGQASPSTSSNTLKFTFKVKGGTFKITAVVDPTFTGTWKFKGGTGKFSDISGGGKVTGTAKGLTAVLTMTGNAK